MKKRVWVYTSDELVFRYGDDWRNIVYEKGMRPSWVWDSDRDYLLGTEIEVSVYEGGDAPNLWRVDTTVEGSEYVTAFIIPVCATYENFEITKSGKDLKLFIHQILEEDESHIT